MVGVGSNSTANVNKNIVKNMSGWGNGSRAVVTIEGRGGGHAFNVEYKNGKLHYYDAQTGQKYDPKRVFDHCTKSSVRIVRVDNLPIADDVRQLVRKSRTAR